MPAHLLRRPSLVPAAHRLGVAAAAAWRAGGALSPPLARSSSSQRTCAPSTAGSTSAGSDTSTAETLRALARSRIAAAAPHPPLAPLEDRHARQHTYLRISLTERCNLRCTYCMPAEGLADLTPRAELLTPHELQRLATLFVRQGVDKIRLTGGEPTVRRDIVDVVARLASLRSEGLLQLGMTSNGMLLPRLLPSLAAAGLTHLNISLDTLDPHLFELITRRSGAGVARVLAAAEQSVKLGLTTKLNVVVVRGVNDSKDVLDFVEWARHRDIVVRFIEYMPFDGNKWRPEKLVPYRVLLERIVERFGPLEKVGDTANDTSKHWRVPGSRGTIGFITR
jgi:cyclic pyranopterin phosphate synthase